MRGDEERHEGFVMLSSGEDVVPLDPSHRAATCASAIDGSRGKGSRSCVPVTSLSS